LYAALNIGDHYPFRSV